LRWDNKICDKAALKDISSSKLKLFLKSCKLPYINKENSLDKLGLIQDGRLLNAAVILFGKDPSGIFPNAKLRCAVFGRTDTAFIIDRQEYVGDLFYLIEKAEAYIMEHIHIGMKLDGLYRIDVPEIDRDAFREAVINAFCHRDYNKYDSVNIAVFKDRLEIRNPGRLYGGLSIQQIKTRMVSQRRNELIADIFHRGHFVERWGRGISLILSKEPTAEFEEIGELFSVTFKRKNYEDRIHREIKLPEKLPELQKIVINNMLKNSRITYAQLAGITGKSREAIRKNINKLKEAGLIKRIGPDKGGYWQVFTDYLKSDDE
jgi:ATP-dependent DNA helicase RecG